VFSETDFTEDLKKFDVPTLVVHGDDDQIVPIGASARMSSKLVEGATLKVYPGAPGAFLSLRALEFGSFQRLRYCRANCSSSGIGNSALIWWLG
jgi:non-heme chloroperoxidase